MVSQDRSSEETTSTAQTCPEPKTNKYGKEAQWWLTMTAEENFYYWISNC